MRLARQDKKAYNKTYPVLMDIGKPWPLTASKGHKDNVDLSQFPLIFCNIVFNWLTLEEQAECIKNVSSRLKPDGDFILATLTDQWNSDEVKRHIGKQLIANPFWTILGALGARRWADDTAKNFGVHRPSVEDLEKLTANHDLKLKSIDENRIFWKTRDGKPTAVVCHFRK